MRGAAVEPEQLGHGLGQLALPGLHRPQLRRGLVEHLVHDGRGHRLDDPGLLLGERRRQVGQGALQLGLADLLGARPELGQDRDLLAHRALADVAGHLLGHQHLGLGRGGGARGLVLVDDLLDVVHVVGVDAVQRVHLGLDVARHGQVDQEERAGASAA